MSINRLIAKTNFFQRFIREYLEYMISSKAPERDSLMFKLCDDDKEMSDAIGNEIAKLKVRILNAGHKELSYGFLLSIDKESHEYIEESERDKFWTKRFAEAFSDHFIDGSITIMQDGCKKTQQIFGKKKVDEDEFESMFWRLFRQYKPKTGNLTLALIKENEFVRLVEGLIEEMETDEFLFFDFEEFEELIEYSKLVEYLFEYCYLLVDLNRLYIYQTYAKTPIHQVQDNYKYENQNWFMVGLKFATGEMYDAYDRCNKNATEATRLFWRDNVNGFRAYVSSSITGLERKSDKNLFTDNKKLRILKDYCVQNDIVLCERFKNATAHLD